MADFVFNIAKGKVGEYASRIIANDPTNSVFVIVLLDAADTDDTQKDFDDITALLAGTSTEANFTNYGARKSTTAPVVTVTDAATNTLEVDMPDITWTAAGNGANDTLTDLIVAYDSDSTGGDDGDVVPCTQADFAVQTDGSDLTAQFNVSGFFRAA